MSIQHDGDLEGMREAGRVTTETLDALQAGRDPRQQIGAVINTAIGFCTLLKDIQLVAVICGA